MKKVFVDTDVCIDLLSGRQPWKVAAELLFSLADSGRVQAHVSSLCVANMDYVLRSTFSAAQSRQLLSRFRTLVKVLPVTSRTIDLALSTDFNEFEDAIQYSCAMEHKLRVLVTRNTRDYKKATIQVLTPEAYLTLIR